MGRATHHHRRGAIQTEYVLLAAFVATVLGVGFVLPELLGDRMVDATSRMDRGERLDPVDLPPIRAGVPSGRPAGGASGSSGSGGQD